ncbi:MAG: VWA domain-containing protein, partial [Gemmatimonadales bacterium]|nr:VWA domain-containing protein [Gemmatimonadales bacterium]
AAMMLVLLRQRDATGLVTFDDAVRSVTPPRARMAHWHQLLAVVHRTQAGAGTAAEPALRRVIDQLRRRGLVIFVSDLLLDRDLAIKALRFLRHRGHQVLVLHLMDPAELALGGPAEARFEDPETGQHVTIRPSDWAGVYAETVAGVVHDWRLACRRHGIAYERVTTDLPFGLALRQTLVRSTHLA